MPRLNEEGLQSLREEIDEMESVLKWLNKRIVQECNDDCKRMLMETRDYVRSSLDCHYHDLDFMSN